MSVKEAGRQRWKGVGTEERKALTAKAGKSAWAKLTPEQRSAENKRRAAKRKKRTKK